MSARSQETRERILNAAAEIAWEHGPHGMSLEAVAAKAGVSKGGLLYHFPSKSRLLEATVETFVREHDEELSERESERKAGAHPLSQAFLDLFLQDLRCKRRPPSGILAAMAEDPSFLNPVRRYERELLERMKADLGDEDLALVIYFAIGGMKSNELLELNVVTPEEAEAIAGKLRSLIPAA
jgi:AcrR family transcriptional regulator